MEIYNDGKTNHLWVWIGTGRPSDGTKEFAYYWCNECGAILMLDITGNRVISFEHCESKIIAPKQTLHLRETCYDPFK